MPVPHGTKRNRPPIVAYDRAKLIAALVLFQDRFGEWPRIHEFLTWTAAERTTARTGQPDPRLPSGAPLGRLWPEDRYSGALAEAKRRHEAGGAGAR